MTPTKRTPPEPSTLPQDASKIGRVDFSRPPTTGQLQRAQRGTKRTQAAQAAARRLDEVLGLPEEQYD